MYDETRRGRRGSDRVADFAVSGHKLAPMHALFRFGDRALAFPRWLALLAGAMAACGFEPLALWPLTIAAMAMLIELLARTLSWSRAFQIGWLFGLGHFTVGNFWIATAFTYQANMPAWLGGIAVVLLALYLAVFPALGVMAAWLIARFAGGRDAAGLAGPGLLLVPCWIVSEWLRSWVFTGFAWNPLGVALLGGFDTPGLAAIAPYIGTYGLSGVLVALAAGLHWALRAAIGDAGRVRPRVVAGLAIAAVLAGLAMELPARWLPNRGGSLPFTLVQPDIAQSELDDPRLLEPHFIDTARLSLPRRPGQRRLVLWPESAIADYLRDGYPERFYRQFTYAADPLLARERIGEVIGPRSLLLTGAVDLVLHNSHAIAARNSITAIDGDGDILAGYAKAHLVPYGEYLALRWLLEPLGATRLVPGALDFRAGPGPRTYDFGAWGKAGMQLCYEITFSGAVVDPQHRPDYIFNPSNDGWFGSWGPPQHLAQARLRAIEEGLPVLRSTTTGISAVIDADGIVRQSIVRDRAGRLDGVVPFAAPPTPFARLGNVLPLMLAVLVLVISLVALRVSRR